MAIQPAVQVGPLRLEEPGLAPVALPVLDVDLTVGDVEVKEKLLAAHQRLFGSARQRRQELEGDLNAVKEILAQGASKASEFASQTLKEVYKVIGIENRLN
jgi:hypothetical protein